MAQEVLRTAEPLARGQWPTAGPYHGQVRWLAVRSEATLTSEVHRSATQKREGARVAAEWGWASATQRGGKGRLTRGGYQMGPSHQVRPLPLDVRKSKE